MNRTVLLLVTIFIVLAEIECKQFSICELARLMHNRYKFDKESLADWLCLVKHGSQFKTDAITEHENGSTDYGLFQIKSRYWCGKNGATGECRVKCDSLLNVDISNDIACIKKIHKRLGFGAWEVWKTHCEGNFQPNVNSCF